MIFIKTTNASKISHIENLKTSEPEFKFTYKKYFSLLVAL